MTPPSTVAAPTREKQWDVLARLFPSDVDNSLDSANIILPVSERMYSIIWLGIILVRVVAIVYLVALSGLYLFISQPSMSYYANLLGPSAIPQLRPVGFCLIALAFAHGYKLGKMILFSWLHRELVYDAIPNRPLHSKSNRYQVQSIPTTGAPTARVVVNECRSQGVGRNNGGTDDAEAATVSTEPRNDHVNRADQGSATSGWFSAWSIWRRCFGRQGFFGVESSFFETRFAIRESTEIISQTFQVYTSSHLIGRQWLNNLYVLIVVTNCWSTPIVQRYTRKGVRKYSPRPVGEPVPETSKQQETDAFKILALERLLCLGIDLLLDIGSTLIIPAILLVPYCFQFDITSMNFPSELLYDDVWFVNMVYENQQVFAITLFESIFTLFPHWSIYSSCGSIRKLVRRHRYLQTRVACGNGNPDRLRAPISQPIPSTVAQSTQEELSTTIVTTRLRVVRSVTISGSNLNMTRILKKASLPNVVHGIFFIWGLVVLGLHLHALTVSTVHQKTGCKQILRPWLSSKASCSVVEFNCYSSTRDVNSVAEDDLLQFDSSSLAVMSISHCPSLRMPTALQGFKNLLGIEIYNSTIAEWSSQARILANEHTRMSYLLLIRTNMSELPIGLVTYLPTNLLDVEIAMSNLSHLPDNLDSYWHSLSVLYLEHCDFTVIPAVLARLRVGELSLIGNQISGPELDDRTLSSSIKYEGWHSTAFTSLGLAYNPIKRLPDLSDSDLSGLSTLSLEFTDIDNLPTWVLEAAKSSTTVYARNSTFCLAQSPATISELYDSDSNIACVKADPSGSGRVPIGFMTARRPVIAQ